MTAVYCLIIHAIHLCILSPSLRYWSINPTRTVPALDVGDRVIGDSSEIVHYLDHTHPSPPLDVPGNTEAEAATGQVFNVFSAWAKNKGVENEEELRAKFTAELEKIEQYIAKGPGERLVNCLQIWISKSAKL